MTAELHCTSDVFARIRGHVLQNKDEQAAFMFLECSQGRNLIRFDVRDFYLVQTFELEGDNSLHIDITDETLSNVINKAAKKGLALGEVHSHPFVTKGVKFSWSDLAGFEDFVPHVSWRLQRRPYLAIVFGQKDFDALVWSNDPHVPYQLDRIIIDETSSLRPTNKTIHYLKGVKA